MCHLALISISPSSTCFSLAAFIAKNFKMLWKTEFRKLNLVQNTKVGNVYLLCTVYCDHCIFVALSAKLNVCPPQNTQCNSCCSKEVGSCVLETTQLFGGRQVVVYQRQPTFLDSNKGHTIRLIHFLELTISVQNIFVPFTSHKNC